MKMLFQFKAEYEEHILWGKSDDGFRIVAKVEVPINGSGDYGYLTMKKAILEEIAARELDVETNFWYDGHESILHCDANAPARVLIDID